MGLQILSGKVLRAWREQLPLLIRLTARQGVTGRAHCLSLQSLGCSLQEL